MKPERQAAYRWGLNAETLARFLLIAKGYRVLGRRVRTAAGEIDLIVKRGDVVAAVEVKARPGHGAGLEAVTPYQRARIARALEAFLARRPDGTRLDRRYDVVTVIPGRLPRHWPDAWRP